MIFDNIYIAIRDKLMDIDVPTPAKSVAWYNGQPDKLEGGQMTITAFLFPACLVRFELPEWQALGRGRYIANGVVYIDVLQRQENNMDNDRASTAVQFVRDSYDNVHAIARALNSLRGPGFNSFKMVMCQPDHAYKTLRVDTIAFRTAMQSDNDPRSWVVPSPLPDAEISVTRVVEL